MAMNKTRSRTQREERLTEVAALHRRGMTQVEIAEELGVSQPQIAYDLRVVRTRYQTTQIEDCGALVAEKLRQYADIRREAWEAWERGKEDACKVVEEFADAQDVDGSRETSERRIRRIVMREGRLPGNQYLQTIMRTLQAERELLGLDAAFMANFVAVADALLVIGAILKAQRESLAEHPHLLRTVQQKTLALVPTPWEAAG